MRCRDAGKHARQADGTICGRTNARASLIWRSSVGEVIQRCQESLFVGCGLEAVHAGEALSPSQCVEGEYKRFLDRGADVIETDIPTLLGRLLSEPIASSSKSGFFDPK